MQCTVRTEYHDMCRHAPLQSHSDHPPVQITTVITVIITVIVTRLRVICDRREEELRLNISPSPGHQV